MHRLIPLSDLTSQNKCASPHKSSFSVTFSPEVYFIYIFISSSEVSLVTRLALADIFYFNSLCTMTHSELEYRFNGIFFLFVCTAQALRLISFKVKLFTYFCWWSFYSFRISLFILFFTYSIFSLNVIKFHLYLIPSTFTLYIFDIYFVILLILFRDICVIIFISVFWGSYLFWRYNEHYSILLCSILFVLTLPRDTIISAILYSAANFRRDNSWVSDDISI